MVDYTAFLDEEIWAFVRRSESFYPPETASYPVVRQREVYDAMCRAFHAGRPAGVLATDKSTGPVALRHYQRVATGGAGVVLYMHGGGFVVGGLESHDDVCAEICAQTGCDVVAVDYRLCPEHSHPAALEDALHAYDWARKMLAGPIVLVGDSAGGNLAAAVAGARRGDTRVAGQVLIYPGLGGDKAHGSYVTHAQAPMLNAADLAFYEDIRAGGKDFSRDPGFAPLRDQDFSALPPTLALGAQCDPLADDAPAYAARIRAAGGQAVGMIEPGLVHGHLRARHVSALAGRSFRRVIAAIHAMVAGKHLDVSMFE